MKKLVKPNMEIVRFDTDDVVVASGCLGDSGCTGYCKAVCPSECHSVCEYKCLIVTEGV